MILRPSVLLIVLAACRSGSTASDVRPRPAAEASKVGEIDRFADSLIRNVPVAGISIVAIRGGRTMLSKGYGLADVNTGRPMTTMTATRIGSITKTFTALAILKLVEQKRVDLDADIRTYLPDLTLPRVTVRQALNHTSGLPDHERAAIAQWMKDRKPITQEFVTGVLASQPSRPAGEEHVYNNAGFHLLGLVVEKASGVSYEEFVAREIIRPVGLDATWMTQRPTRALESRNYYLDSMRLVHDSVWDLPGIWAAGGMFSSAHDLATFLRALATGKVVAVKSFEQMVSPTILPSGVRADYGLGIRLGAIEGHPKWGHTGSARSTRAAAAYYPSDSLAVVVLMNTEHEDMAIAATDIEGRVARTILGISTTKRADLRLSAAEAVAYTGTYADPAVQNLIVERDGVLQLSRVGSTGSPVPLLYQGGDVWADPEFAEFLFVFQKRGERAIAIGRYDNGWFVGVRPRVTMRPEA